jgi:hypothetical protein
MSCDLLNKTIERLNACAHSMMVSTMPSSNSSCTVEMLTPRTPVNARRPIPSRSPGGFLHRLYKRCISSVTASTTSLHFNLLASICTILGSASLTLFRYSAGCCLCNGFPSKYTVSSSSLSPSSFSTSWKLASLQLLAQNSVKCVSPCRPERCSMGFALISMTRRFLFSERPESEVSRLWEMCNSSREVREERFVMVRRRLDWMLNIFRLVNVDKPPISVILFLPSHSSSRFVSVSSPVISRMRFAPSSIWRRSVSPSRFSMTLILFWTK